MKKEIGLWIDHSQAIIVINLDQEEEIKHISSNMEKHVRYSGASEPSNPSESHTDTTEDGRDRRFNNELNCYYDDVIEYLRNASSILIFGPGEAKIELQKRLRDHGFSDQIIILKTTDKMTNKQISVEVQKHFQES